MNARVKTREQFNEVQHYVDMVREHMDLDQPDEASGWIKALIEEAEKLQTMLNRQVKKAAK